MKTISVATAGVFALLMAACSQPGEKAAPAPDETAAAPSPLAEAPAPAPVPSAAPVLATGAGPAGTQVSLVRAQVTGNVLTVELSYRPASTDWKTVYFDVDKVSVIDDATSNRYGVLKDNANAWMASPLGTGGRQIRVQMNDGLPAVVWFKFAAPPATSPTISVTVPDVSPFDGVAVQR